MTEAHPPAQQAPDQQALRQRLGDLLRTAREEKKVSLSQASEALRIHHRYLAALEAGDWSSLPDTVYARAFARQYAQWLGVEKEVRACLAEMGKEAPKLKPPATYPDAPISPGRKLAYLAGALLFVLLAWSFWPRNPPPAPSPLPMQEQERPAKPTIPPPVPERATPAALPSPSPEKSSGSSMHRIEVRAKGGRLWLQLRDPESKEVLKEALLADGEAIVFETEREAIELAVGNAAATEVFIDGKPRIAAGELGPAGKVRRVRFRLQSLEPQQKSMQPRATTDGKGAGE